jgi:hypothetical protein
VKALGFESSLDMEHMCRRCAAHEKWMGDLPKATWPAKRGPTPNLADRQGVSSPRADLAPIPVSTDLAI